jgi:hypothetical protein
MFAIFQSLKDKRASRVLQQAGKFKMLVEQPMNQRMDGLLKGEPKKNNSVAIDKVKIFNSNSCNRLKTRSCNDLKAVFDYSSFDYETYF